MHDPKAEYWRSSTRQQELLSKPPHEAVIVDGPEQVVAYVQQLRPVPDANRRYLPDAFGVEEAPGRDVLIPGGRCGRDAFGATRLDADRGIDGLGQAVQHKVVSEPAGYEVVASDPNKPCKFVFPTKHGDFEIALKQESLSGSPGKWSGQGTLR